MCGVIPADPSRRRFRRVRSSRQSGSRRIHGEAPRDGSSCSASTTARRKWRCRSRRRRRRARAAAGERRRRRRLAVLVPGAMWETKQWTIEGFAGSAKELAARLRRRAGGRAGRGGARARAIQALAPQAADLCGRTGLAEMVALIRRAALVVTNDSRPHARGGRAGEEGGGHLRANESGAGGPLRPAGLRGAAGSALLAVQLPPAEPMPVRPRLHAGIASGGGAGEGGGVAGG